jgi:methionine sulfoxide reductase catalytic subunit
MKGDDSRIGRRRFVGMASLGVAALASGCQISPPRDTPTPGASAAQAKPTAAGWHWSINYIEGTPNVNGDTWRLKVDGLVERSLDLSLADLRALPATEQRSRMKCVECWSAPARWLGVSGADLMALARPLAPASHVTFDAVDGYDTTLPLSVIVASRTLLVYGMDGGPLPADNGYPLRLIVPSRYGYKNCKAIIHIGVTDKPVPGYWEHFGYSDDGTIAAGTDYALDLAESFPIPGGEITDH